MVKKCSVWACLALAVAGSLCWLLLQNSLQDSDAVSYLHSSTPEDVPQTPAARTAQLVPCSVHRGGGLYHTSRDARGVPQAGYVLPYSIHEQQTKASANLFSLQCWGGTLHTPLYVVEPFTTDSRLHFPLDGWSGSLRLRDTFDMSIWQQAAARLGHSLLTSWEDFAKHAPRDLIVARFKYGTSVVVSQRKSEGILSSHLTVDSSWKQGCNVSVEFTRAVEFLTSKLGFKVAREICYNFEDGAELTVDQFNRHLFGGRYPGNVSVMLEEWRGFTPHENGKRVLIYDSQCTSDYADSGYAWPSSKLLCEARGYTAQFMGNKPYIAIMLRLEKIHKKSSSRRDEFISDCLNRTLSLWKSITPLQHTFLAMDYGKYGSNTFSHGQDDKFRRYYEEFYAAVYPGSTLGAWEGTFEAVTSVQDSGYVAALQKTLVGGASCIVLSGGGSFQRQALSYYQKMHPSERDQCIYIVKHCS